MQDASLNNPFLILQSKSHQHNNTKGFVFLMSSFLLSIFLENMSQEFFLFNKLSIKIKFVLKAVTKI